MQAGQGHGIFLTIDVSARDFPESIRITESGKIQPAGALFGSAND